MLEVLRRRAQLGSVDTSVVEGDTHTAPLEDMTPANMTMMVAGETTVE